MSGYDELIGLSAVDVSELLHGGEVSPLELLDALEARIAAVDGTVNALPILCFERARSRAQAEAISGDCGGEWLLHRRTL